MWKKKLMFMLHERHFCLQIFKNFQKLVKERQGNSIFEIGRRWLCSSTIKLQNWNYYAQFGSSGKQLNTHCKRKHNLNLCPAFGSGTTSSACKVRRIFYCRVETWHCMTLHDIAWQARYVITKCKFKLQPFNGNKDNVYLQQNNTSLEGTNMAFQGSATYLEARNSKKMNSRPNIHLRKWLVYPNSSSSNFLKEKRKIVIACCTSFSCVLFFCGSIFCLDVNVK